MVLNYAHKAPTDPRVVIRTTSNGFPILPADGSLDFDTVISTLDSTGTMIDGNVSYPASWGHTGNDLFNKLCIALGSPTNDENGLEIRMRGRISSHTRMFHMKMSNIDMCSAFRYGTNLISFTRLIERVGSNYYHEYDDHSTNLGINTSTNLFLQGAGDQIMVTGPVRTLDNNRYWRVSGQVGDFRYSDVWLLDTGTGNPSSYHQIWVRANKSGIRENPKFTSNSTVTDLTKYGWSASDTTGWSVSSSSGIGGADYQPYMIFVKTITPDSTSSFHSSLTKVNGAHTLSITYPIPTLLKLYTIQSRHDANGNSRHPTIWKLQGSNDLSTWVDIKSENITGPPLESWAKGEVKSFDVSDVNSTQYTSYRLFVTNTWNNNTNSDDGYLAIGEWKLYTYHA